MSSVSNKKNIKRTFLKQFIEKRSWISDNRSEFVILVILLSVAAFLRLFRISEYLTFLGDEGRDVIIVRRLLVDFDPILIGPGTSIGNMYLGPLYYYLIALPLLFANFSPVGPATFIAILGVVTVWFVWFIAREWFGKLAGFVAALLYATAPVVIIYSRSSWNPNIMPFFALVCVYGIWRLWKHTEVFWLPIIGVSFAFVMQSHYLGLVLIPTLGLFYLISGYRVWRLKTSFRRFIKYSLAGLILFVFLMSPLVIFDARHGWQNFSAMEKFFTERQTTVSAKPWSALPKVPTIASDIILELVVAKNELIYQLMVTVTLVSIYLLTRKQFKIQKFSLKALTYSILDFFKGKVISPYILIFVWLFMSLIGFGIYKQHIYAHYYGFIFPAPFLLVGGLIHELKKKYPGKFTITNLVIVFLAGLLLLANMLDNPLRYPPNKQLQRAEEVAKKIGDEAKGEKINLAVLAERNYEDGYQYFIERWNFPFVEIDPQRIDDTVADQLFVVCEMPKEKCDPVNSPKAEIANFGWSEVAGEWNVGGVTLYKLIHAQ